MSDKKFTNAELSAIQRQVGYHKEIASLLRQIAANQVTMIELLRDIAMGIA